MQSNIEKYPFSPIASQQLGTSYSSLEQIGALYPLRGFGGAGIQFFPNIATGNLVVKDRTLHIEEAGGPIELSYTYNSQAGDIKNVWQFSHKKFTQLDKNNPIAMLQEHDGCVTNYSLDAQTGLYFAPACGKQGRAWLRFDEISQQWIRYCPAKDRTEYYNTQGNLQKSSDRQGRIISYEYDNQHQLIAITGQSGSRYEIRRSDGVAAIYLTSDSLDEQLLQLYQFDEQGRLVSSQTADGYKTDYTYGISEDSWQLFTVKQSDQSLLKFSYEDTKKLSSFNVGQKTVFNIQYPDSTHSKVSIQDGFKGITQIGLDNHANITDISRSQGYDNLGKQTDTTSYIYTPANQLENIIRPDHSQEKFSYEQIFGLLQMHTQPDGQTIEEVYQQDADKIRLIGEIQYEHNKPLVTRYTYDTEYDNNKHTFQRFKISPEGRVTEYRPDKQGNIASTREYLGATIDLTTRDIHTSPSLAEMTDWISKQDPQQVTLNEYAYNPRGQCVRTRQYAHIDTQGNGIIDDEMGEEYVFPNLYGQWFTKQTKQDDKTIAIARRSFDNLQRITSETDALNQTKSYQYHDAQSQVQITYPEGKTVIHQKDDKNKLIQKQETVGDQTRTTKYGRDTQGRVVLTTRPDGQWMYSFYDHQDRLGFTVTPSGIVTEYRYDAQNCYDTQIEYATSIDPKQLFLIYPPPPGILPSVSELISLIPGLQNPDKDHVSYNFKDATGRLIYSVDPDQIVTQYFYNQRNLKTAEITYQTELTEDQLQQLKSGQAINLTPDSTKDRTTRYFYDNDGYKIAKQDSAGYITEYVRDNAGRIKEKILYDTKQTIDLNNHDYNTIKPVTSDKDAHHYYFRNARGKIIAGLNPGDNAGEYYYKQYQYYANGLKKQVNEFASVVTQVSPEPPPANPAKDRSTYYQYDVLNRPICVASPSQKIESSKYDVMSNLIFHQTQDSQESDNDDADHQRTAAVHYDAWNQKDLETNVFGGQITHVYDATGLHIHTIDALNNITYYFYDIDRRPVAVVEPTGIITENTLNNFGKTIATRKYDYKIPDGEITAGGYLTDDIRKLFIQNPDKDQVIFLDRNKSGLVRQKTDPNQAVSTYTYNAFKECVAENLPVNENTPSLTLTHEFDNRGLEISAARTAPDTAPEIIIKRYDNLYGKETSRLDARNGLYSTDYSVRGKIQKKSKTDGSVIAKHEFTYTAFEELESETDSFGNITSHDYDIAKRTHTVVSPVPGVTEITTNNIFKEAIAHQDGSGNTEHWTHAPNGEIETHTDQLGNQSVQTFDVMGQLEKKTDANQVETVFEHNGAGYLTSETEDAQGLKLATYYDRDSFGNAVKVTDPRGIATQHTFDRCNHKIQSILDDPLNLTTQKIYNFQGKLTSQTQGDKDTPTQYQETYQIDAKNRTIGKTIDPEGLKITTQQTLDTAGDVIAKIDANGNITRKFHDILGRLRFVIDPEGGVSETHYDSEDRIDYTRIYENGIDPAQFNDQTDIKTLLSLVKNDPQDTLLYHFYDPDGKERFQVNSLGAVAERHYNLARREIKTVQYDTKIDPQLLYGMTTQKLAALVQSGDDDRINYKIRNVKQQERFIIDGEKYIVEKRYDNNGNVIAKIRYAVKINDPEKMALIDSEKVLDNIILDTVNDRATYQVFDSRNKPQYVVDGEGNVTQFWHDENENLIETCAYQMPIDVPASYDDLKTLLRTLVPNPNIDCVTKSGFDNANRKINETDPLGYIDKFQKDAMGNTIIHTDRAGNNWLYHYDSANRLETETTPPVPVVTVVQDSKTLALSNTQTTLGIQDTKVYDNNGNESQIIKAANMPQARTLECTYNKRNQLIQTKISHVSLNDETQAASLEKPPVKTGEISTRIVYNAKKLKICEQNENGGWHFYIYNSEGKAVYEIDANGYVMQYVRNSFNEIVSEKRYDTKLTMDLTQYTQTGISLQVIEQAGVIISNDTADRPKTYKRDHRGDVIETQMGPTMYYLPNGTDHPQYAMDYTVIKQQYNAFRECYCKAVLKDPVMFVYTQQLYWFDRRGKTVAECDPVFRVVRHIFDGFGHQIERREWANPPKILPAPETALSDLDKNCNPSPKDRTYQYVYNPAGDCIQEITKNIVIQSVSFDKNNFPAIQNQPAQDLVRSYRYNEIHKRTVVTYEDGSEIQNTYDARGLMLSATDVPRQNQQGLTLVPLTCFGNDAFGQRIITTKFKDPVAPEGNPDNQCDMKLLDNRGLPSYTQNAEGVLTAYTYTPTRKTARQIYYLTNSDARHIDEKGFKFDSLDYMIEQSISRDNQVVQRTLYQYNAFGNCVAEGAGDGNYPLFRRYDKMNNCWLINEGDGISKLRLYNLSAKQTLEATSATHDLSQLTSYDKDAIDDILALGPVDLERLEVQYDDAGRKIVQNLPVASMPDPKDPANVPLNIISGNGYPDFGKSSLTFVQPQETNYVLKIQIWQTALPEQKQELPIKTLKGRCGVDVSTCVTDVYTYEMDYFFTNPVSGQLDIHPRYRTTGQVQIDNGVTPKSQMLVVSVENEYILSLTGNTEGLTSVELWEGSIKLTELPVQNQNGKFTVNLSQFNSGVYTVVPIVPGKKDLPGSLSFTIYTPVPSKSPLSKQIETSYQIVFQYGSVTLPDKNNFTDPPPRNTYYYTFCMIGVRLILNLPTQYYQFPSTFVCSYLDNFSGPGQQRTTFVPGQIKYEDSGMSNYVYLFRPADYQWGENVLRNWQNSMQFNTYLGGLGPFKQILHTSINLQLNATDQIAFAREIQPNSSSGDGGVTPMVVNFPINTLMYISPLTGFKTLPTLSYLDVTMDRLATWKKIPAISMDDKGVFIDIINIEPCIYPFKTDDQLTFSKQPPKHVSSLKASLNENNQFIAFKQVMPEKGQSDIGFKLLKTNRKTVTDFLESQQADEMARQTLAPEILSALMTKMYAAPDDEWELLNEKYEKEKTAYRKSEAMMQQRKILKNIDVDHNYLKQAQAKVEAVQNKMAKYCAKPEVYQHYVNHLKDKGELGFAAAFLYARYAGISVYFWQKDIDNPGQLKLLASHNAGKTGTQFFSKPAQAQQETQILHLEVTGFTHFNVLLSEEMTIEDIYGDQPQYSFMVLPPDGIPYPSNQFPPAPPLEVRPAYSYQRDAWNNLTQVVDTLGNETDYDYDYNNQRLSMTQSEVVVVNPDGGIVTAQPVTQWGYNIRGHNIVMTDPDGNTKANIVDNAGQETGKVLGDGVLIRQQSFDALGRRESHTDGRGYAWKYHCNRLNKITLITYPSGLTNTYVYNEQYRIKDIDQAYLPTTYDYDATGNISLRISPMGFRTAQIFDANHQMTYLLQPDGFFMTWTRDYFGQETSHTNLSGVQFVNQKDFKGQVVRRYAVNGGGLYKIGVIANWPNFSEGGTDFQVLIFNISPQRYRFCIRCGTLSLCG
jgi:YD repeat-containing protein